MTMNKLNEIFKVVSFLDEARWCSEADPINYYKPEESLGDDIKILTHWLCYITDRRMPFERIWKLGGYVFSDLAYNLRSINYKELLRPDGPNGFLKKKGKGYVFISRSQVNDNTIYNKDELTSSNNVKFAPRYYPSDYFSILYTLDFLKKYNFSFSKFIKYVYEKHGGQPDFIKRLLFSLYLMTYYKIGRPKKEDIDGFENNLKNAKERTENINKIMNFKEEDFKREYDIFIKNNVYGQKRAWCSLRDYIKHPKFKGYFKAALNNVGISDTSVFFLPNALNNLELPGDVWNNNNKFRKCILSGTEYKESTIGLNKILRDYFEGNKNELVDCYPEQFDITFDFVPRMCEKNNCDICPIGKVEGTKGNHFQKICVKNENMYCSVAMIVCDYKIMCHVNPCPLLDTLNVR